MWIKWKYVFEVSIINSYISYVIIIQFQYNLFEKEIKNSIKLKFWHFSLLTISISIIKNLVIVLSTIYK